MTIHLDLFIERGPVSYRQGPVELIRRRDRGLTLGDLGRDRLFVEGLKLFVADVVDPVLARDHVLVDEVVDDSDLSFLAHSFADEGREVLLPLSGNVLLVRGEEDLDVGSELGSRSDVEAVIFRLGLDGRPVAENVFSADCGRSVLVEGSELDRDGRTDVAAHHGDDESLVQLLDVLDLLGIVEISRGIEPRAASRKDCEFGSVTSADVHSLGVSERIQVGLVLGEVLDHSRMELCALSVSEPLGEGRIQPVSSVAAQLSGVRDLAFIAVESRRVSSSEDARARSELLVGDGLVQAEAHESVADVGVSTEDFVEEEKHRFVGRVPVSGVEDGLAVFDRGKTENVTHVVEVSAVEADDLEAELVADLADDLGLADAKLANEQHSLVGRAAEGEVGEFGDGDFSEHISGPC